MNNWEEELYIIDDPYRVCEIDGITYHEDFGTSCQRCDMWICDNCWPEHAEETGHTKIDLEMTP